MELSLPPLDGSLLTLVNFVDFHAEHNPDRPWLVYPSPSSNEGLASVTFKELATATHLIASTLRPGRQGSDDQVVAILLHTDNVVYVAVMLGLLRAGLIVSVLHQFARTLLTLSNSPSPCRHETLFRVSAT